MKTKRVIRSSEHRVIVTTIPSVTSHKSKIKNLSLFPAPYSLFAILLAFVFLALATASAQDWVKIEINRGAPIRLEAEMQT